MILALEYSPLCAYTCVLTAFGNRPENRGDGAVESSRFALVSATDTTRLLGQKKPRFSHLLRLWMFHPITVQA
jgi:hypothetical protein